MKDNIGGGEIYDNSWGSVLLFRVRSNTLKLGWRAGFVSGDTSCVLCQEEVETLKHFLVECEGLRGVRERFGVNSVEESMGFGRLSVEEVKNYLVEMWKFRLDRMA